MKVLEYLGSSPINPDLACHRDIEEVTAFFDHLPHIEDHLPHHADFFDGNVIFCDALGFIIDDWPDNSGKFDHLRSHLLLRFSLLKLELNLIRKVVLDHFNRLLLDFLADF